MYFEVFFMIFSNLEPTCEVFIYTSVGFEDIIYTKVELCNEDGFELLH